MTEYVYKLKNGKLISAYADEKGNISITKEALEIMVNSWNDGYQKGYSDGNIKGKTEAIEECARVVSSMVGMCQSSCPIDCQWGTEESCVESWKIYLNEQLKENNDN